MKVSYIDVDEQTAAEQVARQLLLATDEDETAWRNDQWYTARLYPTPLRPEERHTTVVEHQKQGMRLQVRTPGDLQTMEFTAFDRVPLARTRSRWRSAPAASTSPTSWRPTVAAPPSTASNHRSAWISPVVTAVGPEVSDHEVGDHVGGLSPTAAGPLSSPVTLVWPRSCPRGSPMHRPPP